MSKFYLNIYKYVQKQNKTMAKFYLKSYKYVRK